MSFFLHLAMMKGQRGGDRRLADSALADRQRQRSFSRGQTGGGVKLSSWRRLRSAPWMRTEAVRRSLPLRKCVPQSLAARRCRGSGSRDLPRVKIFACGKCRRKNCCAAVALPASASCNVRNLSCLAPHDSARSRRFDLLHRSSAKTAAERAASFSENGSGVVTNTNCEPSADNACFHALNHSCPAIQRRLALHVSAKMPRQHDIARRCRLQHVEKARKMLRHLEQPDGMSHRRSVDHDLVVIAVERVRESPAAPRPRPCRAGWCRATAPVRRV